MANNCLVTKLKSVVENDNLSYLESATIYIKNGNGSLYINKPIKLIHSVTRNIINLNAGDTLNASTFENTNYEKYYLISKYEYIPYSSNVCGGFKFNIEDFKYVNLNEITKLAYNQGDISGNIDELPYSETLTSYRILNNQITGTVTGILSKFPNIGKNGGNFNTFNTNVSGTTADLTQLSYIPTEFYLSNYITGNLYDTIVRFREISETKEIDVFSGNDLYLWSIRAPFNVQYKVGWTSTTSYTIINGVRTTFDNNGNIIQ